MSQNRVENNLLYGPKSLEEQLACARRQLYMRQRDYANLVAKDFLDMGVADDELGCMAAIVKTLEELVVNAEREFYV